MNSKQILSLFIALIILMQPVLGAELSQKKADDKPVKKDVELEQKELKESQKEFKKSEFKYGDEKAKSKTDIKLKTEKRQNGLKISAENPGKGSKDKHDILIAVEDIPNFNYKNVRIDHYSDTGTLDARWIQEVNEVDGYVLIPDVEFSSISVDGFTGTYTKTIVGADITDFSTSFVGNYDSVHVSIPGADGRQMDENNSADYPIGATKIFPLYNSTNLVDNAAAASVNVSYDGNAYFNGSSYIYISENTSVTNYSEKSVFFVVNATEHTGSIRQILYGNYFDEPFGDYIYFESDTDTIRTGLRNEAGDFEYNSYSYNTGNMFVGYVYDGAKIKYYVGSPVSRGFEPLEGNIAESNVKLGWRDGYPDRGLDTDIDWYVEYPRALNSAEVTQLYTSINGTAARTLPNATWVPVINGEADLPVDPSGNVTAIEVITSTGTATSDVSITGSWTENVTIIEESEDENHVYVYANITTSQNSTSGSWEYDVASLNFTYNMSINSDNSNVTGTYHNGTVTLDTGLLNFGDSFNYTLTFDKLTSFTFWANWISKTSTKAVVEYNSTNSNVENDFYLENMTASSTFDFKYSNGTVLVNSTSDSSGYLQFDDVTGLVNDTYMIETQAEKFPVSTFIISSFVAVVAGFFGLRFGNQRRKR